MIGGKIAVAHDIAAKRIDFKRAETIRVMHPKRDGTIIGQDLHRDGHPGAHTKFGKLVFKPGGKWFLFIGLAAKQQADPMGDIFKIGRDRGEWQQEIRSCTDPDQDNQGKQFSAQRQAPTQNSRGWATARKTHPVCLKPDRSKCPRKVRGHPLHITAKP